MKKRRKITEKQLEKMWALREQGVTTRQIAEQMGRAENVVWKKLKDNPRTASATVTATRTTTTPATTTRTAGRTLDTQLVRTIVRSRALSDTTKLAVLQELM